MTLERKKISKAYKFRVGERHNNKLVRMASKVDHLFNYACDLQIQNLLDYQSGLTEDEILNRNDLIKIIRPEGSRMNLRSDVIEEMGSKFASNLKSSKKPYLKYRN